MSMFSPAGGLGEQSKYFDDELLLDGSYSITSVTLHSSSIDENNSADTSILRKGLLLAPSSTYVGYYLPLSTENGYLNGTPTQYASEIVVLARETRINYIYVLGNKRERQVEDRHMVVPVYLKCNIYSNRIHYNNSSLLTITQSQWDKCQRINRIDPGLNIYRDKETIVRALLYKRKETIINNIDFN